MTLFEEALEATAKLSPTMREGAAIDRQSIRSLHGMAPSVDDARTLLMYAQRTADFPARLPRATIHMRRVRPEEVYCGR